MSSMSTIATKKHIIKITAELSIICKGLFINFIKLKLHRLSQLMNGDGLTPLFANRSQRVYQRCPKAGY